MENDIYCAMLRNRFHLIQKKRAEQLEYLLDLQECNDFYCRHQYLRYYELDDYHLNDHQFIKEIIELHPSILLIYRFESHKLRDFIYCKGVAEYNMESCVADMNLKDDDREIALKMLRADLRYFFYFSQPLRSSVLYDMLRMDEMNQNILLRLDTSLFIGDRELVASLIDRGLFTKPIIVSIKGERELCFKALGGNRRVLVYLKDCYDWFEDKEALDALCHSKNLERDLCRPILNILPGRYADHLEFVSKLIEFEPKSFVYASVRVKSDKAIALKILKLDPSLHAQFDSSLSTDRDIQLEILKSNPTYYYRLNNEFKYDKEFILMALKHSEGFSQLIAENIPEQLLTDEDVIGAMVSAGVVKYLDPKTLTRQQVLQCIQADGTNIEHFEEYMEDLEILKCAACQTMFALQYIPEKYQTLDFVMDVVKIHPEALNYIPNEFRNLDSVIEMAIHSPNFKIRALSYLPQNYVFSNEEILWTLLYKTKGKALSNIAPTQLHTLSKSLLIGFLRLNGKNYSLLSPKQQEDSDLLKTAIKHGFKVEKK